jgi:hypothetical protein
MTLLAQSITTESGLIRPKMTSLCGSVPSRSTFWSFSNSSSSCPSFAAFRPPLLMASSLSASSVMSSYGKTSPMFVSFHNSEEGGGVRSWPGAARTILHFHIISARPSKQPRMVRTFLKVHKRPRLAYALRCRGY